MIQWKPQWVDMESMGFQKLPVSYSSLGTMHRIPVITKTWSQSLRTQLVIGAFQPYALGGQLLFGGARGFITFLGLHFSASLERR
jgi:hypothetical protein